MGVKLTGMIAGLASPADGEWHVHTGSSCVTPSAVFGHFFTDPPDPWNGLTYTPEGTTAVLSFASSEFSWSSNASIYGRALVVHDAAAGRAGCGGLPLQLRVYPPPPPPSAPPPPPPPVPPPRTAAPSPLQSPRYRVTANFTAPGTVETFDVPRFVTALSALMSVPASSINIQVYPASVIVVAQVEYGGKAAAEGGARTLNTLSEPDYARAFGEEVAPLGPATVDTQSNIAEGNDDGGGGTGAVVAIVLVIILLVVVAYCYVRRKQKQAGTAKDPGVTSSTVPKKRGWLANALGSRTPKERSNGIPTYSSTVHHVELEGIISKDENEPKPPRPPAGPPPDDAVAVLMEKKVHTAKPPPGPKPPAVAKPSGGPKPPTGPKPPPGPKPPSAAKPSAQLKLPLEAKPPPGPPPAHRLPNDTVDESVAPEQAKLLLKPTLPGRAKSTKPAAPPGMSVDAI